MSTTTPAAAKPAPKRPKHRARYVFDVYEDDAGQWRWRIWARNGQLRGTSGEGHARKSTAVQACVDLQRHVGKAAIFIAGVERT